MPNRLHTAAGLFLLSLLFSSCATTETPNDYPITFHAEGSAAEAPNLAFSDTVGDPAQTVYFRTIPEVTHKQMDAIYPFPADDGESKGALFLLNQRGKVSLQNLTRVKQGELMLVMVNGKKNDVFWIEKPIDDGILVVWSGITDRMIKAYSEDMALLTERPGARTSPDTSSSGYNIFDELAQ